MRVKIDRMSHDFKGICNVDNKVIFVPGTLPGEIVDIKIVKNTKKYSEGKVISFVEVSEKREESKCPYSRICGGCSISHIEYIMSLQYKKDIVVDIIKRYADINIDPSIISNGEVYGYRNKVSFKILEGHLALTEEKSNKLVKVNQCLLANGNINKVVRLINDINLKYVTDVIIRGSQDIMVIFNGRIDKDSVISILSGYVSSIILNGETIYGRNYITTNVNGYEFAIFPTSFFQVNTNMIKSLYDRILKYAKGGRSLLDLYCGAGTIGIYLANSFELVRGIEINKDAIRGANLNKQINNINNITFECKNVDDMGEISEDVVVVDPPRSGLDRNVIDKLLSSEVEKIIYVSCNPITFARDLNILKVKYKLEDIVLFDMFPNTRHVECVTLLQRKDW